MWPARASPRHNTSIRCSTLQPHCRYRIPPHPSPPLSVSPTLDTETSDGMKVSATRHSAAMSSSNSRGWYTCTCVFGEQVVHKIGLSL